MGITGPCTPSGAGPRELGAPELAPPTPPKSGHDGGFGPALRPALASPCGPDYMGEKAKTEANNPAVCCTRAQPRLPRSPSPRRVLVGVCPAWLAIGNSSRS